MKGAGICRTYAAQCPQDAPSGLSQVRFPGGEADWKEREVPAARSRPRGCADATPQQLDMNIVSEIGDIKNDNALLLQQGNLRSPRDRISKSSAKNQ